QGNPNGQERPRLWGQRPHNSWVRPVETQVAIELAAVAVARAQAVQFGSQRVEQFLAVGGPVRAVQLVLGHVAADEPVAERQGDVDSAGVLGGQSGIDALDGADEILESEAGTPGP